jgi:ketosteroid isomerase-like protein
MLIGRGPRKFCSGRRHPVAIVFLRAIASVIRFGAVRAGRAYHRTSRDATAAVRFLRGEGVMMRGASCRWGRRWACTILAVLAAAVAGGSRAADTTAVAEAVRKASADYVAAYNARDFAALGEQWTERAELVEGNARVEGRDAIVTSIRGWLARHPEAKLELDLADVDVLADSLVRVRGEMRFTERTGSPAAVSRFESLRVLHGGTWRLTESVVEPSHASALRDLDWLVGTWRADAGDAGRAEMTFEKALGGYCLVGRGAMHPQQGEGLESLVVVHADRGTGLVRAWMFDSTGARAEGVVDSDGATLHQTFVGTPADGVAGRTAAWVQVIAPSGADAFTLHAIERSIDGVAVPDGAALHFRRAK